MGNSSRDVAVDLSQSEEEKDNMFQFVTFWIGSELFGVDILDVKEITPMIDITPVFHAPEEVKGYVNIRGEIHLVIDMRYLLDAQNQEPAPENRIVIFKPSVAQPFGILVDRVGDVLDVHTSIIETENQIEADVIDNAKTKQLVTAICKLEDELLMIIDARKLLQR